MPHSSSEQKLKSICTQERFTECYCVLSSESRGKVCGFSHHQPNPSLYMDVLFVAGAGGKRVSGSSVSGHQGLK